MVSREQQCNQKVLPPYLINNFARVVVFDLKLCWQDMNSRDEHTYRKNTSISAYLEEIKARVGIQWAKEPCEQDRQSRSDGRE